MIKANEKFDINYIDSSSICSFTRCPAMYMMSRLSGLSKSSNMMMAADYGTDMHEALPYCYGDGSAEKAIEIFTTRWNARNHDFNDKRNLDCAINTIYDFYNSHKNCPYEIVQFPDIATPTHLNISKNELPFLIDIGGPLPLAGRIDAPVRWKTDNTLWALDYKGHPLDTLLVTTNGVIRMGDLKAGDFIMSPNGKPVKVTSLHPLGKKQVYKVTLNDGSVVDTTDEHIWTLIRDDGKRINKTTIELTKLSNIRRFRLPTIKPVNFDYQHIPIEPYTLGALLGDGHFCDDIIGLTTSDDGILSKIKKHYQTSEYVDKRNFTTNVRLKGLKNSIIKLGLMDKRSRTKFIPECYLYNIESIRWAILKGLMDTDGGLNAHGSPVYTTISPRLATGVKLLVESLGGMSKIRVEQSTLNGKNYGLKYVQNIRFSSNLDKVFGLDRKKALVRKDIKEKAYRRIVDIEATNITECQCIKVANKDGLYLVEDFIPTHNTSGEVSQRFFNGFENSPQALAYTIALSQLTEERARGFIVEAIRVSKKNAESQMHMVFIKDNQIEHFIRFVNNVAEQILECNDKQEWPMNCAACGTYSMFHIPGYSCDFLDVCTNPDKESMMKFYDKNPPWHPFAIGDNIDDKEASE